MTEVSSDLAVRIPPPPDWKPRARFPAGHRYAGRKECSRWSYRRGRQCEKLPIRGKGVCREHGGTSSALERGPANPNFRTGRYSKDRLPSFLADAFDRALSDGDALSLRRNLALVDAEIELEYSRLRELELMGGGVVDWREARGRLEELRTAVRSNSPKRAAAALTELEKTISVGVDVEPIRSRLLDLQETRRKLTETEVKREVAMKTFIPVDRLMALLAQVAAIIREEIRDPDGRRRLAARFRELVSRGGLPQQPS